MAVCLVAVFYAALSIFFVSSGDLAAVRAAVLLDALGVAQVLISDYQRIVSHRRFVLASLSETDTFDSSRLPSHIRSAYEIQFRYMTVFLAIGTSFGFLSCLLPIVFPGAVWIDGASTPVFNFFRSTDVVLLAVVVLDVLLEQYAFRYKAQAYITD